MYIYNTCLFYYILYSELRYRYIEKCQPWSFCRRKHIQKLRRGIPNIRVGKKLRSWAGKCYCGRSDMQNAPFRSPGGQVFSRGVPLGHMRYYTKYYINLLYIYIYIWYRHMVFIYILLYNLCICIYIYIYGCVWIGHVNSVQNPVEIHDISWGLYNQYIWGLNNPIEESLLTKQHMCGHWVYLQL